MKKTNKTKVREVRRRIKPGNCIQPHNLIISTKLQGVRSTAVQQPRPNQAGKPESPRFSLDRVVHVAEVLEVGSRVGLHDAVGVGQELDHLV